MHDSLSSSDAKHNRKLKLISPPPFNNGDFVNSHSQMQQTKENLDFQSKNNDNSLVTELHVIEDEWALANDGKSTIFAGITFCIIKTKIKKYQHF